MDSDYKLFEPEGKSKNKNQDEKNKKKKEHASGYYKFVNQFRNHIKTIENEFSGEEVNQLENNFNYINKYENEFEEQRENCINCYAALKEQISLIEKIVPNFDINIFNTFFQTFEEYYSFFTKSQEILKKFSEYNDDTQNLYYICKRKNFCIDALKEFVDKISVEYADKIEQYEILNEKYKNLTESYEKLYKIYQETKNVDLKKYENIDNKELMIKNLNETIQQLTIENDRIKKKYFDCSRDLEGLNMAIKVNYVLKSESDKYINELQFKMKKYEIDNKTYRENIKNLKEENEKLIQEKESLEVQINSNLNTINANPDNKNRGYRLSDLIEENEEIEVDDKKEEKENESEELDDFQGGNDLGELLRDCEEKEIEEENDNDIKNGQNKENIQIHSSIFGNNDNNNINDNNLNANKANENADNNIENENNKIDEIININEIIEKKDKIQKMISYDKENSFKKSSERSVNKKTSSKLLRTGYRKYRHGGSVKLSLNKSTSGNINSAYNVMFKGNQFQLPSRIVNRTNFDYFKQFFFLLFQSMKMNSERFEMFLGFDPETLYTQCRNEHVPFHKYQKWLEKQLLKKELSEKERKYEDFDTITGIFCSSFI